ncbi:MAG: glycosyltransferase family 2 protein [Saprospiraceae bacterium]|nr:glycosyltransferase family 2 protein [Saprospiraceae bacterium]
MKIGVSIIICCFNSEFLIEKTLQHILNLRLNNFKIEAILIDNNSSDNTSELAQKMWNSLGSNFDFKIIKEPNLGLNYARKTGVLHSNYEYLIFCDDDNRLDSDYAINVYNEFESNTDVGIIGGWSEGQYEVEPPYWFKQIETSFAIGGYIEKESEEVNFVWGAGLSIRRSLAIKVFNQPFKTLDRKGNSLLSGGDLEICDKVKNEGYKIRRLKKLKFFHFMPKSRLNWEYCTRLYEGFGYSAIQYQKEIDLDLEFN